MKRIFTKIIGLLCFFMLFFANVQGQQDTVYVYQKDASLYKREVSKVDSIRYTKPSGNNTLNNMYNQGSIVYSKAVKDIDSITFSNAKQPTIPVPIYTISFNGNGHSSGTIPISITADSGTVVVAPAQGDLAKTGYNFTGWNTKNDGSGTAYAVAANITLKSALTLYVQWEIDLDTTFIVNGVSFNMIYVQGGTFTMGCTEEQGSAYFGDEKPTHMVSLSEYHIGELELTQGLWKAVMGADNNPSSFKGDSLPVDVSWEDCQIFISALNTLTGKTFSLPTEAQWEYAARGGHKSQGYTYAGSHTIGDVAWYSDNGEGKTHKVGTKLANELGLYDMSGNVWEWCNDWYCDYTAEAQTNPKGPTSGSYRMGRGGGWGSGVWYCRVSYRSYYRQGDRDNFIGFRLVLDPRLHILSFNGNDHSSGTVPASITADSGTVVVAPAQGDLAKKGYNFTGWNTQSDGSGTAYAVSANITLKSALTLYAQWAIGLDTTFIVNGVSFNMIYVQGGTFTMGCTEEGLACAEHENPNHTVSLSDYYIGELELTQGLWKAVMGADNDPSFFKGDGLPVENVSWEACQSFISELSRLTGKTFSLPTEAQWEYAARGGHKSQGYTYAGSHTLEDVAWYYFNSDNKHEVGTKSANELGLYDMSGNVMEWCNDWYGAYTAEAQTNPKCLTLGSFRVIRGGSRYRSEPNCRVSYRGGGSPDYSAHDIGFRLVLDPRLRILSFNGNGHTIGTAPVSITADSGTVVVAPAQGNLDKTGYNFIGWNTQSDGLGTAYAVATNITLKSALTLYAQWEIDPDFIAVDTTFIVNGVSFNMIYVQGGTFTMSHTEEQWSTVAMACTEEQGSAYFGDEKPTHMVSLSEYHIGELELTQGLWKAVMGADNNLSSLKGDSLPVENVSWEDCQIFISALNTLTGKTFSLPTEAQWEYAARGGHKSQGYKYAGSHTIGDVAWYSDNGEGKTHKVGTKLANELGLYDMSGNVMEWCNDWYGDYTAEAQTNPKGPTSGSYRVYRGGTWGVGARGCCVSVRYASDPGLRSNFIGFRLVLVQ